MFWVFMVDSGVRPGCRARLQCVCIEVNDAPVLGPSPFALPTSPANHAQYGDRNDSNDSGDRTTHRNANGFAVVVSMIRPVMMATHAGNIYRCSSHIAAMAWCQWMVLKRDVHATLTRRAAVAVHQRTHNMPHSPLCNSDRPRCNSLPRVYTASSGPIRLVQR